MPIFNPHKARGKRLPSIDEFACLLIQNGEANDHCLTNDWGLVTEPNNDILIAVQTADQHFRFMPGPEFSPRLYRGETVFHQRCVPTIYRPGISFVDHLFAICKQIELSRLMDLHPATVDLKDLRICDLSFDFNIEAIAQHYGFKTSLMDFSRSKDVAMFFATCEHHSGIYSPLQNGTAVLYTADLKALINDRKELRTPFLPLGLEPLPRPEAQKALAVRLRPDENLNNMSWVSHEKVQITPELSQFYFEMFDGGKKLFPVNPFDEHVSSIRCSKLLPLDIVAFAMDQGFIPNHPQGLSGVRNAFLNNAYQVELSPMTIDSKTIQSAKCDWDQKKDAYYKRVVIRKVCNHFVGDIV
jgi:hypothetical protein